MPHTRVPTVKFSITLLRKERVPIHIVRHCVKVYQVANRLCALIPQDIKINCGLVKAGALLHDICKMKAIQNGGDHAKMGGELLKNLGFHRVGEIIRQHVFLDKPIAEYSSLNEEIIVNYADKRVQHTQFVSLEDRFDDILKRYGRDIKSIERINKLFMECKSMELMIFDLLPIRPNELMNF